MGYLDSFADPLFKTDAEGRIVFFPAGKLGKGRIVPDLATAERLRTTVKWTTPLLIVVAVAVTLTLGLLIGLPVALALGLLLQLYLMTQVRGMPVSDARLTFSEVRQRQAKALGGFWLGLMIVLSVVLTASSVAAAFLSPEQRWVGIGGAVLFGVCLVLFLNMWRLRRA